MQARADGNPKYRNSKLGRGQQGYLAHKLCQEAGVAEGSCGSEEMKQFQDHLGPQDCQIVVFEGQQGLIWFKDCAYNNASKKICLLKIGNHFHGITSIPALLNRSYYCHHCEKGYCHETSKDHNCRGQNCSSCKRTNKRCPNFATFKTPEVYCGDCNHNQLKICLLKIGNHFHGITSIPALLNRSYYCHHCEKGYCHETSKDHNCRGQNCSTCKRTNKRCPNFATFKAPEVYCGDCNRFFYGQECYMAHKQRGKNICSQSKKCHEWCKEYKYNPKKKHVCREAFCRNCKEKKDVNHRCFIQPIKEEKEKTAWGLCTEAEQFEEADNEADCKEEEKEKVEPLVCAIDFECSVDEVKDFRDVCVGWRYLDVEGSYREAGTAMEMLTDVMANTMTEEGKERKVFVYAHNMRGFDSLFILAVLYDMGYKIDRILSMGAKYLSFECSNLVFRDSLNFF